MGLSISKVEDPEVPTKRQVKLLLLGTSGSGKTTIAKQIKILFQNGFGEEEKSNYKPLVYANVCQSVATLLDVMKLHSIDFRNKKIVRYENKLRASLKHIENIDLSEDIIKAIKILWGDEDLQKCYKRSRGYQLDDTAEYFLDNMFNCFECGYTPSEQDILRLNLKTTGIKETTFECNNVAFTMVDVGGNKKERRKWVHCYQDVSAIIFCVNLSCYDQFYDEEEEKTNKMLESMRLFQTICTNSFFSETCTILFLNKKDIFERKITKSPLTVCFPEYEGENHFKPASQYVRDQFKRQSEGNEPKDIFVHLTCATDTSNIQFVFDAVSSLLLRKHSKALIVPKLSKKYKFKDPLVT